MPETYRLRLYADNGSTVAAEFSTDPVATHPDLLIPEEIAAQEIDLAAGRAKIGSCRVEVIDVPTTPGDQDTGFVTSILKNSAGQTARIGRRAHLEVLIGAGYENVINGVIEDITLGDSYASYLITIKDQRENERRTRAFIKATTSSVLPRGVIEGFGFNVESSMWLVPPTQPIEVTFTETGPLSILNFPIPGKDQQGRYRPDIEIVWTAKMREVFRPNAAGVYDRIRLLWRNPGGGAYNIVENLGAPLGAKPRETLEGGYADGEGGVIPVQFARRIGFRWPTGVTKPTLDSEIEIIFGYNGPPTKEYPLHLQDMTFGELLKGLYDGDYSDPDAGALVLYDSTAVLALTEPVLARITEPLDDEDGIWKWTEKNIFAPLGAAPALDADGLISPVRYQLPPVGTLPEIDDTNCEPIPGWSHTGSDAVNVVSVEYPRFVHVPPVLDPNGEEADGDGIFERKITIEHQNAASIAILGERPLRIQAETLGAIGGAEGEPITGDVTDEIGAQLAAARTRQATDRFIMGGQHFAVRMLRSALGTNRVGDWFIGQCSWWPDYDTGERGPNRLLQIIRIQHLDTVWSEVELVDAGPDNTPVGSPTLGTVTAATTGIVSIPVTAIAAGSEARVDYAINDTEPSATSALWRFAGRTAVTETLTTPPAPAGSTVWVRARGEKEGRRPSGWTTAVSVAVPGAPRVTDVQVLMKPSDLETGAASVVWIPNAFCNGVRVFWSVHDPEVEPSFDDDIDLDADTILHLFAAGTVGVGERLTVDVEPWTGFSAGSVSGTAGERIRATALRDTLGAGSGGSASSFLFTSMLLDAPTFGAYSDGVRIGLWDHDQDVDDAGHAIGVDTGTVWFGVGSVTNFFKWYGGETLWAQLHVQGMNNPKFIVGNLTLPPASTLPESSIMGLSVKSRSTDSGAAHQLAAHVYAEQTVATVQSIQGFEAYVRSVVPSGTLALELGVIGNVEHDGAGTVTKMVGVAGGVIVRAGTVTKAVGVAAGPIFRPGGTVTEGIGLLVEPITEGTTRFQIKSEGTSPSRFLGRHQFESASVLAAIETFVTADSNNRFSVDTAGKLQWGPGNAAQDLTVERSSGNVKITPTLSGSYGVAIEVAAAQPGLVAYTRANNLRFRIGIDGTTEGGSNAGNDFAIFRYNDAGSFLDNALAISRATGAVTIGGRLVSRVGTDGSTIDDHLVMGKVGSPATGNFEYRFRTNSDADPALELVSYNGTTSTTWMRINPTGSLEFVSAGGIAFTPGNSQFTFVGNMAFSNSDPVVTFNGNYIQLGSTSPTRVRSNGELEVNGAFNHIGTNWRLGNKGTLGASPSGWSVSNITIDRILDASSQSLDELYDIVGTLISDLFARGVVA